MKLITELIEYCLRHNLLTDEHKLQLETEGFYVFDWSDKERRRLPLEIDEEDLLEAGSAPRSHSSNRRHGKHKSAPVKPILSVEELNEYVQEDWNKLTEQFPRYQSLWDSWKAGHLSQVFADGATLNDVYALMSIELRDFHDFSGPPSTAFRQLLRQVGTSMGKYSWVIKCPEIASIVEFLPFRQQLFDEVKTLYETDCERFAHLSSQNGRLQFRGWEKSVHPDTTSMKVWTILNIASQPVEQEKIPEILTWKTAFAFAMQIDFDFVTKLMTDLEKWDCTSSTVITAQKLENVILKSVTIPEDSTWIRDNAFYSCRSLTSVTIPEGVKGIGNGAFHDCGSLTSVVLPKSVTAIGWNAFNGCRSLKSVIIPKGVTEIGEKAFCGCDSLTSVVIPEGVTVISEKAFCGCSFLTSVVIPVGVTDIEYEAFYCCSFLTSIEIPESVTVIGERAFDGCSALMSVVIPDSVTEIGSKAFCNCPSLTSVAIPKSVTVIKEGMFHDCHSLTSVAIAEGVTEIEREAFRNCSALTSVVIPEGVKVIGDGAFYGCSSLTSAMIPESVMKIETWAFSNCSKLTIHAPVGSEAEKWAKKYKIPFEAK